MSTILSRAGDKSPLEDPLYRESLRALPPSAKLVAKILETSEPLTKDQLATESLLPDRTVRYALTRLQDEHLIGSRHSYTDARKRVYFLVNPVETE